MNTKFDNQSQFRWIFLFVAWISIFLFVIALKELASIILPATIAVLLACILNPSVKFLTDRLKIPRLISIFLHVLILAGILMLITMTMFSSIKTLVSVYPKYEDRFLVIYKELSLLFDFSFDEEISLIENLWGQLGVRNAVQNIAITTSASFVDFFSKLFMILLITVFMMIEISQFKTKLLYAFKTKKTENIKTIIQDITSQTTKYLSVKFIISLITGLCIFTSYSIIGIEFAFLWGLLAFAFNFIPTIGSIVQCTAGTLFALLQFWPNPGAALAVLIAGILINMILGNIIEPSVMGENLNLSPFIILASLSFWSWLWGFIGMVIAVPMMVILRIVCENIKLLEPVAIFMGSANSLKNKTAEEHGIQNE